MKKRKSILISMMCCTILAGCDSGMQVPDNIEIIEEVEEIKNENATDIFDHYTKIPDQSFEVELGKQIEKDYESYNATWSEEDIMNALKERDSFYQASSYYAEIVDYWENVRETRDISNRIEHLFETNVRYYTEEDFEKEPDFVIRLAKNEIYARHGYLFHDENLYNYFMGCIWYSPTCKSEDFNNSLLNEYEKANIELLGSLDS